MTATADNPFLPAILADPRDDTPRLVYADWLDENDPSRRNYAAFIRAGVEASRPPGSGEPYCPCMPWGRTPTDDPCPCGWCAPRRRERELWAYAICDIGDMPRVGTWITTTDWIFDPEKHDPRHGAAIVRRGFVAEVRCPLATLLGGAECESCGGTGRVDGDRWEQSEPCPDCGGEYGPSEEDNPRGVYPGTGRTPGVGEAIFRAHPIERVVATDKTPLRIASGSWGWYDESHDGIGVDENTNTLPTAVFRLLTATGRNTIADPKRDYWAWYDTAADATAALSAALVAVGRERAGLPPLAGVVA